MYKHVVPAFFLENLFVYTPSMTYICIVIYVVIYIHYIHYSMVTALGFIVIQECIFRNKILLLLLLLLLPPHQITYYMVCQFKVTNISSLLWTNQKEDAKCCQKQLGCGSFLIPAT